MRFFSLGVFLCVTLGLAALARSEILNQQYASSGKPIISRPQGSKFTTILSIDGGGSRVLISVMSLVWLETSIKAYIIKSKPELLPDGMHSPVLPHDFDISLADYFDVMSGSAAGGWAAAYLASKGTGGALNALLSEPEIIGQYGKITPGSARALIVFFFEYASIIYPTPPPPPEANATAPMPPPDPNAPVPGFNVPLFTNDGVMIAMDALFGNNTLADLATTCLIPILDIETGTIITMAADHLTQNDSTRIGFTDFTFTNFPMPVTDNFKADIMFREGIDFLLRDVAVASGANAVLFPAVNITSISGPETTVYGADGFLGVSGNPTFMSLAFAANATQTTSFENFAILSLGNGVEVGFYEDNANGGIFQWIVSEELLQIILYLTGGDFSNQLDLLFYANPRVAFNQYLRIQTFADAGTPEGELLGQFENTANLTDFQDIGMELASNYSVPINSFVQDFIFA